MKIEHKNLVIGINQALQETFFENKYADKSIERLLKKNKKWGSKDRAFVSESFYEIIRWKNKLEFYSGKQIKPENIYYLIATYFTYRKFEFPIFWDIFKGFHQKKVKDRFRLEIFNKHIFYAIPKWLEIRFQQELGDSWENEMLELNKPAKQVLRANTLKTNPKELKQKLEQENISTRLLEKYPYALELIQRKNVFITPVFKEGLFEMQDASSQLVADFMEVTPTMRVIDACAGAGGKTLHIASLMQNKGTLIALDIHQWKLDELKLRARRAGAHNIQMKLITDLKVIKRLENSADRVLLDAPCSGLGVLKRNPDSKWKIDEDFINRMIQTQAEILQKYSKMVKINGKLIYATCSILPSENNLQIENFIKNNPNFEVETQNAIMPSNSGYDGFFMAKLKRIS